MTRTPLHGGEIIAYWTQEQVFGERTFFISGRKGICTIQDFAKDNSVIKALFNCTLHFTTVPGIPNDKRRCCITLIVDDVSHSSCQVLFVLLAQLPCIGVFHSLFKMLEAALDVVKKFAPSLEHKPQTNARLCQVAPTLFRRTRTRQSQSVAYRVCGG